MARTIYLHIGLPKTGTSTIQSGLSLNHQALLDAGWYIPATGRLFNHIDAHHNIALDLRAEPEFDRGKGDLDGLLAEVGHVQQQRVLVSTEIFTRSSAEHVARLRRKLSGFDVVVVAYVRRQDLWLHSMWVELCKFPRKAVLTEEFRPWIGRVLESAEFHQRSYFANLDVWGQCFGVENVRLRVLERSQVAGNVFHDFLSACDVPDLAAFAVPADKNVSPGIKTLKVLRQMMPALTQAFGDAAEPYAQRRTMMVSNFILDYGDQQGWNATSAYLLDAELHRAIMGVYASANRDLARKYLGRDELFLEPYADKPHTPFETAELSGREALDLLLFVLPRLATWTALQTGGRAAQSRRFGRLGSAGERALRSLLRLARLHGRCF